MYSTSTVYPPSLPDATVLHRDRLDEPRTQQHISPSTPQYQYRGRLSTASPGQLRSSSASPALNTHTPAESIETPSVHYQSSEYSEVDDSFLSLNFGDPDGVSAFLDPNEFLNLDPSGTLVDQSAFPDLINDSHQHVQTLQDTTYLPLSPDKTPSLPTASPEGDMKGGRATFQPLSLNAAARDLSAVTLQSSPTPANQHLGYQLTPGASESEPSSDEGLGPAAPIMQSQSPRVTVSMWGHDDVETPYHLDSVLAAASSTGATASTFLPNRDVSGRWVPDEATGQGGLDPSNRPSEEVPSMNEMAAHRQVDERIREVGDWLESSELQEHPAEKPAPIPADLEENVDTREIALGDQTENTVVPEQTYFSEKGGELTQEDVELMRQHRNWGDAPIPFAIHGARYQPESSQAAIEKYQKMWDNTSVISHAATWGTRRRSVSGIPDIDVISTGNLLKKLSLNRGASGERRPSILKRLVKMPSANFNKRSRDADDTSSGGAESTPERRESQTKLAPPSPTPGGRRKQSVPSINTMFVGIGSSMASIGAVHARNGSLSASVTSPKSPGVLATLKNPLNRNRSKSDLTGRSQPAGIVDLWRKEGGPVVSNIAKTNAAAAEADDDDDDDDELYEDENMKSEANKAIDEITPNFSGFQQHVLKLNPLLKTDNTYLVDRIAHQQIVRYKNLLNLRVKHLQHTASRTCPCTSLCIAQGGSANILDSKGDPRGLDPLSARYDGSDGDITPLEGAINPDSFPQDIPMPPTSTLPAEFECQLCFQGKKFQKPSDWTKHVHEDVQPFTCTWDRCRDPKIFKRKADWVRHENEGHRHLEWWTCDVEDCRHVCYRRDNFLQHLVREHKFPEPKVKTKAAIKRAGNTDPTWQKVESCHQETHEQPHNEPCRFCGKTFPTWKKLTVHLAKHMEQISLPILKLVARKELEADTIISPVQDPPPRTFPAAFAKQELFDHPSSLGQTPLSRQPPAMAYQGSAANHGYYPIVPPGYPAPLYTHGFENLPPQGMATTPLQTHGFTGLNSQPYSALPVTTSAFISAPAPVANPHQNQHFMTMAQDLEPFPAMTMNALGLQGPSASTGVQYGGLMDPNVAVPGDHSYTPQGSVSPYSHSPHQPQTGFYPQ